jgi:predicted oxidoreductase
MRPGNSVPRYHVVWGTSRRLVARLLHALQSHPQRAHLDIRCHHAALALTRRAGVVVGCSGRRGQGSEDEFEFEADSVLIASGGITGDLDRVRTNWPTGWGEPPRTLLNGSHPQADGRVHDAAAALGARVTHLDWMWNYAAGVHHPTPHFPGHGLSLIPCKSALWLDPDGRRLGPIPLVTGFDTHWMVEQIARRGLPYTWQILNRRIAERELAVSGAEHNPLICDRRPFAFAWQLLRGNRGLVDDMLGHCKDFVAADNLAQLTERMNTLAGTKRIDAQALHDQIRPYDAQIERGRRFHDDDQLRRIAQLRGWLGERLRTCAFQRILDPSAGPLIAVRAHVLTRKSMGGLQTDLGSRVLDTGGTPIPGLLAAGEAAGFGGGGSNGKRSLEGTFLSGCILTAQAAARTVVRG